MANMTKVSDGVMKELLQAGNGQKPQQGQTITVQCTGLLAQGVAGPGTPEKKFWSTKDPGQKPFSFQVGLGKVIKGWDEGCMAMELGERSRLHIEGYKGYGAGGFPAWGITPNANLVFDIEILKFE